MASDGTVDMPISKELTLHWVRSNDRQLLEEQFPKTVCEGIGWILVQGLRHGNSREAKLEEKKPKEETIELC